MEELNQSLKTSFVFDVKNEEEDIGFRAFQKKYVFRKTLIQSIIFAILAVIFILEAIKNPDSTLSICLAVVAIALIYIIWNNQRRIRINLLEALKEIEDDKYEFELYEDYFSIRTILPENPVVIVEETEEIEDSEIAEEEVPKEIPPSIIKFNEHEMAVNETDDLFIIYMRKQTIYVIPKRCLTEEKIEILKNTFSEKLEEDYEFQSKK